MSYTEERDKWIQEYARQLPGSFDFTEAKKCYDAGLQCEVVRGLVNEIQELYISVYGEPVASCAISNYESALREIEGKA